MNANDDGNGQDGMPDERPQRRREYSGAGSTLGLAMLIIVIVGLAVWYFQFRGDGSGAGLDDGYGIVDLPERLNVTGEPAVAAEGRAAPNFQLPGLDEGELILADLRGDYVLLNFWASWCGPCRSETPALREFAEEHPDGLTVVGVNIQEAPSVAREFIERFGVHYPVVLDRDGDVTQAYRMVGPPMTVLVDPEGVIVEVVHGELGDEHFERFASEVRG